MISYLPWHISNHSNRITKNKKDSSLFPLQCVNGSTEVEVLSQALRDRCDGCLLWLSPPGLFLNVSSSELQTLITLSMSWGVVDVVAA